MNFIKKFHGYGSKVKNTIYSYQQTKEAQILDKVVPKGHAKLYCNDCIKQLKMLPSNSIDLVVTDPPYEYSNFSGNSSNKHLPNQFQPNHKLLNKITDGFNIPTVIDQFVRVMKHINMYIWCSNDQVFPLLNYIIPKYQCNYTIISWDKDNSHHGTGYSTNEYCIYFYDNQAPKGNIQASTMRGNYVTPENQFEEYVFGHPTIKPIFMMRNFINNSSKPHDTVLDAFVGSGSTGVASTMLDRNFIGIDIEPKCIDETRKRINQPISFNEGTVKYEINFAKPITAKFAKRADHKLIGFILGELQAKNKEHQKQLKAELDQSIAKSEIFTHVKLIPHDAIQNKYKINAKIGKLGALYPNKWTTKALHHKYWWITKSSISRLVLRGKHKYHQHINSRFKDAPKHNVTKPKQTKRHSPTKHRNLSIMYDKQTNQMSYKQLANKYHLKLTATRVIIWRMNKKYGKNYQYRKPVE